jgi:hypothetical protein
MRDRQALRQEAADATVNGRSPPAPADPCSDLVGMLRDLFTIRSSHGGKRYLDLHCSHCSRSTLRNFMFSCQVKARPSMVSAGTKRKTLRTRRCPDTSLTLAVSAIQLKSFPLYSGPSNHVSLRFLAQTSVPAYGYGQPGIARKKISCYVLLSPCQVLL